MDARFALAVWQAVSVNARSASKPLMHRSKRMVASLIGKNAVPEAMCLHVPRQSSEIIKHGLDQYFPPRILSDGRGRKQGQQIAHLVRGLFPVRCRSGDQLRFQGVLRRAQRLFVGGDLCQEATKVSGLLRGHSTMLVEFD